MRRSSSRWATRACRSSASRRSNFDVLVIDAFSSDAIPVHLITAEALGDLPAAHEARRRHRVPRHEPLPRTWFPSSQALAHVHGLLMIHIADDGEDRMASRSDWLLLSDRRESLACRR